MGKINSDKTATEWFYIRNLSSNPAPQKLRSNPNTRQHEHNPPTSASPGRAQWLPSDSNTFSQSRVFITFLWNFCWCGVQFKLPCVASLRDWFCFRVRNRREWENGVDGDFRSFFVGIKFAAEKSRKTSEVTVSEVLIVFIRLKCC